MLKLKAGLQAVGISQVELARAVGLSAAAVAQWLNHEQWPSLIGREAFTESVTRQCRLLDFDIKPEHFDSVTAAVTAGTEEHKTLSEEDVNMLLRKQTLSPEARRHFGIFKSPFDDDVQDVADVFSSPAIRYVREYLWQTAKSGGFMAVVGESGAGKSTLRKDLEDRIAREQAPVVLVQPYVLGMEETDKKGKTLKSASIADAIIVTVAPNERPKQSMEAKSRQLHRILKDSRRAGFQHCLVIEEAHALNTQTLKHLKRFLELEDGFKRLLSIVLIGQSELKVKLSERSPEVREVVQRCEVVELPPLDAQLDEYLRFKFGRVGAELEAVFERDALDGIRGRLIFSKPSKSSRETVSLMYPLMVNNLVTAALNAAASLGFAKVSAELIREA